MAKKIPGTKHGFEKNAKTWKNKLRKMSLLSEL
jgi:hypothetical protein